LAPASACPYGTDCRPIHAEIDNNREPLNTVNIGPFVRFARSEFPPIRPKSIIAIPSARTRAQACERSQTGSGRGSSIDLILVTKVKTLNDKPRRFLKT
jgi:hypothetical protein